jgi:hypothetical protein
MRSAAANRREIKANFAERYAVHNPIRRVACFLIRTAHQHITLVEAYLRSELTLHITPRVSHLHS